MYKRIYSIFIPMFLSFQAFSAENAQQSPQSSGQNNSVSFPKGKNLTNQAAGLMAAGALSLGYALGRKSSESQIKNTQKKKSEERKKIVTEVDVTIEQAKIDHPQKLHSTLDGYGSNVKKLIMSDNKNEVANSTAAMSSSTIEILKHRNIDRKVHEKIGKIIDRSLEI